MQERERVLEKVASAVREGILLPRRGELFEELWKQRIEEPYNIPCGIGSSISLPKAGYIKFGAEQSS